MSLFAMIYGGLMGHNPVIRGSLLICLVTIVSMGGFSSFELASANNCGGGQPEQSNGVWAWTFLIRGIASVVGSAAHLLTCGMLAHVCRSMRERIDRLHEQSEDVWCVVLGWAMTGIPAARLKVFHGFP